MNPELVPSAPAGAVVPAKAPTIVLVRGDAFFTRRLELPAGASAPEVASFVALQLEELSPFPLDQLYHGHAVASDRRTVFIYAAYRRRFPSELTERWAEAESVLPEFVAALRLKFPSTTVVLLRTDATLTALYFETDRELPARIASRPLAPDAPADVVEHTRRTVSLLVAAGSAREVALRARSAPTRRAKGLQFFFEPDGAGTAREVFIPGAEGWSMDVRDPEFIANQRKRQGVDVLFWRVVLGAAAMMALLLAGELLFGASQAYASWLNRHNNSRAAEVTALRNREFEANSLEEFGRSGVQPFDMLTAVGKVRPRSVYFTRATAKGAVLLEIEGTAQDVASINAYEAALKAVPTVQSVDVKPVGVGAGGSGFRISVTFNVGGFTPPALAAQGQP